MTNRDGDADVRPNSPRGERWDSYLHARRAHGEQSVRAATVGHLEMKRLARKSRHKIHGAAAERPNSKESNASRSGSRAGSKLLPPDSRLVMWLAGADANCGDCSGSSSGKRQEKAAEPEGAESEDADETAGPNNIEGLKSILIHPFSVLLLAMPLGAVAHFREWGSVWCFWLNLLAMVPLAKILGDGTEELAAALKNDTVSGLLNATLGNVVEMVLTVQTLRKGLIDVVKATLLGSILSNILLVLGTSFLLGGIIKHTARSHGTFHVIHSENGEAAPLKCSLTLEKEQIFSVKAALMNMAMQLLACMTCILPTVFYSSQPKHTESDREIILEVSRVGAIIIGISYMAYIFFQLVTHKRMLAKDERGGAEEDEEDEEEGSLTLGCSLGVMVASTIAIAFSSELLVHSIEEVAVNSSLSRSLIGVVLLPFAGNACEHASAVRFAIQDRPGLSIGIAVGSSTQIALCVVPFAVLMGWVLDQPMDLNFGPMNSAVMLLSVLVAQVIVLDGRANWLKGFMLCTAYLFIGALYYFFPLPMS